MSKNKQYFSPDGNEILTQELIDYLDEKDPTMNVLIIADTITELSDMLSKDISSKESKELAKDYMTIKQDYYYSSKTSFHLLFN